MAKSLTKLAVLGRRSVWTSLVRVAVLGCLCLSAVAVAGDKPTKLDAFARCLAKKKATMYGAFYCPHCRDQKELFGESFQYVPYVECVEKGTRKINPECTALGIKHTPTWLFENDRVDGKVLSLQELSQKSGCPLP